MMKNDQGMVKKIKDKERDSIDFGKSKIEPLLRAGCDRIVLGCTHFPHLRPVIEKVCAGRAVVIDPSDAVARQAKRVLSRLGLTRAPSSAAATHVFIRTGEGLSR